MKRFNDTLLLTIAIIAAVIAIRLYLTAEATGNWRGAAFSFGHTVIVAVGGYLLLRSKVQKSPR